MRFSQSCGSSDLKKKKKSSIYMRTKRPESHKERAASEKRSKKTNKKCTHTPCHGWMLEKKKLPTVKLRSDRRIVGRQLDRVVSGAAALAVFCCVLVTEHERRPERPRLLAPTS